jgi:hypothetical protein
MNHGKAACAAGSEGIPMDDAQSNRSLVQKGRADGGMDHIPVTFWMPDGSSHEGMTPCIGGQVIFIESKQAVQLGTEISIKLTTKEDEADSKWEVTEGIVVWHCPLEDDFKNRAGFGVSLRGGWPKPSCPTETGGSKEPA